MSFWGWVGAIAAGWFTASILLAGLWATVGRRIFRKPPQPPVVTIAPRTEAEKAFVAELRRIRQNGRGF